MELHGSRKFGPCSLSLNITHLVLANTPPPLPKSKGEEFPVNVSATSLVDHMEYTDTKDKMDTYNGAGQLQPELTARQAHGDVMMTLSDVPHRDKSNFVDEPVFAVIWTITPIKTNTCVNERKRDR